MSIDKCRKYADKTKHDGRENEHRNWYHCPYTCDNTSHPMDAIKTKGICFSLTQINRHTHTRARAHTIEEKRQFYAQSRETNKQNQRRERERGECARDKVLERNFEKSNKKNKWKISNECVLFFLFFFAEQKVKMSLVYFTWSLISLSALLHTEIYGV